jgi:hypothetical protein
VTVSRPDEPAGTATQVGVALATLAEAWLRDSAYAAVGLFSLAVAFCGLVAVVRRAPASRVWLAILGGAVLDAAAITLFLTSR